MPTIRRRFADDHHRLVEVAFLLLVYAATSRQYVEGGPGRWPGLLIATAACLSLLWRRGRPRTVTAVTSVCAGLSGALVAVTAELPVHS